MVERNSDPVTMLGDRGYNGDAFRDDLRERITRPEIPTKLRHAMDSPAPQPGRTLHQSPQEQSTSGYPQ
jgi:hypothetical protein